MKKTILATLTLVSVFLLAGNLFAKDNSLQGIKADLTKMESNLGIEKVLTQQVALSAREYARYYLMSKDLEVRTSLASLAIVSLDKTARNAFMMFIDNYNAGINFEIDVFFNVAEKIDNPIDDIVWNYCDLQEEPTNKVFEQYKPETNTSEGWKKVLNKAIQNKMPMCYFEYLVDAHKKVSEKEVK